MMDLFGMEIIVFLDALLVRFGIADNNLVYVLQVKIGMVVHALYVLLLKSGIMQAELVRVPLEVIGMDLCVSVVAQVKYGIH